MPRNLGRRPRARLQARYAPSAPPRIPALSAPLLVRGRAKTNVCELNERIAPPPDRGACWNVLSYWRPSKRLNRQLGGIGDARVCWPPLRPLGQKRGARYPRLQKRAE